MGIIRWFSFDITYSLNVVSWANENPSFYLPNPYILSTDRLACKMTRKKQYITLLDFKLWRLGVSTRTLKASRVLGH